MKNKRDTNFEKYKNKMEQCIKWHFLGGLEADEEKKDIQMFKKMIKYYEKVILVNLQLLLFISFEISFLCK